VPTEAEGAAEAPWPNRIWQTWKTPLIDKRTTSWRQLNPHHEYHLLTDADAEAFVDSTFSRPEDSPLRLTYHALNDPVLKADLLRYLVVFAKGGVYTDIDTTVVVVVCSHE